MSHLFYPYLLKTHFDYPLWGGDWLANYLPMLQSIQPVPSQLILVQDDEHYASEIENGPLAGKTIRDWVKLGIDFMGKIRNNTKYFPIRVRLAAYHSELAVQVHPGDESRLINPQWKTNHKAWYIISSAPGAKIYAELRQEYTQQQLLSQLGSGKPLDFMYSFDVLPGDTFYFPSGRVHAASGDFVALVIEETYFDTFTLSSGPGIPEYKATTPLQDSEMVKKVVNFKDRSSPRYVSDDSPDENRNRKIPIITTSSVFFLEELRLSSKMHHRTKRDSFHLLIAIDQPIRVAAGKMEVILPLGQGCLIPANVGFYSTEPTGPGKARVLRVI